MGRLWALVKETYRQWSNDNASRLAAALAYYAAVSIAPLLVLLIALVGLVFGEDAARRELISQVTNFMGEDGAEFIKLVVENADEPAVGGIASLLSLAVLLWGSTNVFTQLQDSLNVIWNVRVNPANGIITTIRKRVLSFGMVVVIGFLLLISLVLSTVLASLASSFGNSLPGPSMLWAVVNWLISFLMTTFLFAMVYKFLPDVHVAWRDVWIGATVTALLFTVGKSLLGIYLGNQGSSYGIAGSVVVFLLWVYYSAQILFFGAEFTQVYATRYGGGFELGENAELIQPPGGPVDRPQATPQPAGSGLRQ